MKYKRKSPLFVIAVFFGSGLSKFAPGTMGTLACLPLWAPMVLLEWPLEVKIALVAAVTAIGFWASGYAAKLLNKPDPSEVVIDEVAGMGITLLFCPPSWLYITAAFALFRAFDILKPWPISWLDRNLKGGTGIMVDDLVAGIFAAGCLGLIRLIC